MRRVLSVLLVMALLIVTVSGAVAENKLIIQDDAGLLSESELTLVYQAMEPISAYCTAVFWTMADIGQQNTITKAGQFLSEQLGNLEGIIFAIDMANREIVICASDEMLKTLTVYHANMITDNVSILASEGNYQECACEAFRQIYSVLSNTGASQRITPESLYAKMIKEECDKASSIVPYISRMGGSFKEIIEFRCCIYAIDRINQLSIGENGRSIVNNDTISALLLSIDHYIDALQKGKDNTATYLEIMEQLSILQNELDGI